MALVALFTSTFSLAVVMVICPFFSSTLNGVFCVHWLLTTNEVFGANAGSTVYCTSTISGLQTRTLIKPLSSLNVTLSALWL
jgi:hypothetical protein